MITEPNQPRELRWHVLLVKPRSEKKVGLRLRELGFETCVPIQKQVRMWSDRKKLVEVVLFRNYVFVATDRKRRNDVFQAGNILKYLSFAGQIATLTGAEALAIRRLGELEAPVQISYEVFKVGDEVEIVSGSLAGFRGRIVGTNGSSRLQLALPNLQCFANVDLMGVEVKRINT